MMFSIVSLLCCIIVSSVFHSKLLVYQTPAIRNSNYRVASSPNATVQLHPTASRALSVKGQVRETNGAPRKCWLYNHWLKGQSEPETMVFYHEIGSSG